MIEKHKSYKFVEVLVILRDLYFKSGEKALWNNNGWCLYSNMVEINLNSICYIDDYPDINDETNEEIYPIYTVENNLEFIYSDELLQDVIVSALHCKIEATNEDLLKAVDYYCRHDCFIEF